MSTAGPFKFPGAFPFCPDDASGYDSSASFVGNLTLTQIMAFAWNLETITINTFGSTTIGGLTADGASTLTLNPASSDKFTRAASNADCMFYGAAIAAGAIGSFPNIRDPRSRVCGSPSPPTPGMLLYFGFDSAASVPDYSGFWMFFIGTDPSNAGKYRLYYRISYNMQDTATQTVQLLWNNQSSLAGFDSISSANITIGGIVLGVYSYKTAGSVYSGPTPNITATSASFTY